MPPEHHAEFVCAMENVLEVYQRPYSPEYPVVCMDETNKQLVAETRVPLTVQPGQPPCFDYEYERHGTIDLFMFTEPLVGWRHVGVTPRRTRRDWALQVRELLEGRYRDAQRVTLVMDNLNTHRLASLYEAFTPAEARRWMARLEVVYTPKHGSWLNIAEIELNVLTRQYLCRRIGVPLRGRQNPPEAQPRPKDVFTIHHNAGQSSLDGDLLSTGKVCLGQKLCCPIDQRSDITNTFVKTWKIYI
jgi:hypothetical protein